MIKVRLAGFLFFGFCLFLWGPISVLFAMDSPKAGHLAVFISGLSGGEKYEAPLHTAAQMLGKVLSANGFQKDQMYCFSETVTPLKEWGRHDFSRKEILRNFMIHAAQGQPYDSVFIFIAGHANGRDEEAKLHLAGEDVNYQTLIEWIDAIPARQMTVILAASQGHVWIKKLARPGRVIVIGNAMREFDFMPLSFLRFFPYAFLPSLGSKETKVSEKSITEIFMETQRKVKNWYAVNKLHATELAWMDADGDGIGQSFLLPGLPNPPLEEPEDRTTVFSEKYLKQRYPMDETLPDALAGRKILFSISGGNHGTR